MSVRLPARVCGCGLLLILAIAARAADEAAGEATKPTQSSEQAGGESPDDALQPGDILAGHSAHGEAFNQGPRQRAYLMEGTGECHFPATTSSPEAQKFIDQGVGQLHGFWYLEAERSFRQAAMLDPKCAIAYWGMAMANFDNSKRGKEFIAKAVANKDGASDREKLYIDALNAYLNADGKKKKRADLVKALDGVLKKYPDDLNAKAFLALHLWKFRSDEVPLHSTMAVDALIEQVLRVQPLHPVHHYRIHLWDYEKAENALESSARCGQSAPAIAHMWHMPGHIYSRLKRYDDAVWQQEASARTDHAYMIRDRVMPDEIHNFAHNNEWLIRNLNYIGRAQDAVDLAKNMIELPRHPKYNTPAKNGSAKYGRMRLLESLQKFELFDELIALSDTPYLEPTDDHGEQIKRLRALAAAMARNGDVDGALQQKESLIQLRGHLEKARDEAVAKAEEQAKKDNKDSKAIDKAKSDARRGTSRDLSSLAKAIQEIDGHLAIACGQTRNGLTLLRKAGGVDEGYLAVLELEAGDAEKAEKSLRDQVRKRENQVLPLAALVEVLWRAGKTKEAGEEFARLRKLAAQADLDVAPLARLAPLAAELNLPADWRIARSTPADVGNRPPLDSLGPFRWHPYTAPSWSLKDAQGKEHSLADFHGRPVVVIFYLGHGCLHCAEQLAAFAPATEAFRKQGIDLVAISTDNQEDLKISLERYQDGAFPFPLVSDAKLEVFKHYRVYDDFEQVPLHGTLLIDGAGHVRWQDISYEPFMDHKFLLEESRRLLAQSSEGPLVSAQQSAGSKAAVH